MVRPQHALIPLAIALACSFDGTGQTNPGASAAPGTSDSSDSSGEADTTGPTPTSTEDPTTSPGPTSDAADTGDTSTTAVGPTSEPMTSTTTSMTTGGACGDGVRDPGEVCDGADLGGQGCGDFGLVDGVLACAGDCSIDTTGCLPPRTCGNGSLDGDEVCDGDELGGQTCEGLQFLGGELACADNCAFDTSGCLEAPDEWYDTDYTKRRKLTIPAAGVTGAHEDFPVVVVSVDAGVIGDLTPVDKLVFADPGKKKLAHEVELADPGRLVVWVELPALDDGADTEFYVYYGDPNASDEADAAATWSNNFLAVWHLGEMVVDEQEGGQHKDSTTTGHTGVQHDNMTGIVGDCRLGRCQVIGTNDWIDVDKDAEFKLGDADVTIAAWVYSFDVNSSPHAIFAKSNPAAAAAGHVIFGMAAPADGNRLGVEQFGAGEVSGVTDIANSTWHHVVWTQTRDFMGPSDNWRIYLDGEPEAEGLIDAVQAVDAHSARIGGPTDGSSYPGNFQGRVDEVQVSTDDRSADWVKTSYANQSAPGTFTLIGPEESL
jgi:hypothetical protein